MSDCDENSLLVEKKHVTIDSDDDNVASPPEIENIADRSKKSYKKSYTNFMTWRKKEIITSLSEKVLLAYFQDMSTKYAPSTLWAEYFMIKSTLKLYEKTDISGYATLQQFLKQKSEGYKVKKSKTFTPSEIEKFIKKAPDEVYLMVKVAVIFGVLGACRRQELQRLLFKDVIDFNEAVLVNIMKTKNKLDRSFTITGKYYHIVKKFIQARPKDCKNERFFLKYNRGKCTFQNVGINAFGNMGKTVAVYLKLLNPELYTGHCFRRTSATLLINAGGDIAALPVLRTQWTTVVTDYNDHSIQNKQPSCSPTKPRTADSSDSSGLPSQTDEMSIDVLPEKSKERYITTYENFISWQKERNITSFCEDVLLLYFEEISAKYKPTSLWAIYSMLKSGLKRSHNVNMEEYHRLSAFLKKLSKGYVCKKIKALTYENVEKFIDEAPNDKYLATKAALILAVTGGFRQQDLIDLTTNDIQNHGEVFVVKLPHTKERSRASFVIQGKYYQIVKKYQSLRTTKAPTNRFFQQFRNGKCSTQVIGKNKFGSMSREIAEYLNLPDANAYTGHSFRKAATFAECPRVADRCTDGPMNGKNWLFIWVQI